MTFWTHVGNVLFAKRSAKMFDDSEKRKRQLSFELQSLRVFEKRSNFQKTIAETFCLTHSLTQEIIKGGPV